MPLWGWWRDMELAVTIVVKRCRLPNIVNRMATAMAVVKRGDHTLFIYFSTILMEALPSSKLSNGRTVKAFHRNARTHLKIAGWISDNWSKMCDLRFFSHDEATLWERVSVRFSVRPSVCDAFAFWPSRSDIRRAYGLVPYTFTMSQLQQSNFDSNFEQ